MSLKCLTTNAFEGNPRMSSLARRSLRTTATAAGIAAIGVGLAGHAFAAPDLPGLDGVDGLDTTAVPGLSEMPVAPTTPTTPDAPSEEGANVPGVLNFETPTVNTAAPELPAGDAFALPTAPEGLDTDSLAAPEAPTAPEAPSTDGAVDMGDGIEHQFNGPTPDGLGQNNLGAMQALDMAELAMEMAQSAAAGESFTENQQIG